MSKINERYLPSTCSITSPISLGMMKTIHDIHLESQEIYLKTLVLAQAIFIDRLSGIQVHKYTNSRIQIKRIKTNCDGERLCCVEESGSIISTEKDNLATPEVAYLCSYVNGKHCAT